MKNPLIDNRVDLSPEQAGDALIQFIEENLDMKTWGFSISFKKFSSSGNLVTIFDSEMCRIKFIYTRERPNLPSYDELRVYYGRSHAPNEGDFMEWQSQLCWCWHDIFDVLLFLDGLSPSEAVQYVKVYGPLPQTIKEFWASQSGESLRKEFPPRFILACQSILWKRYKQELFSLFDIRNPASWKQFRNFLGEFHSQMGTKTYFRQPPKENIC